MVLLKGTPVFSRLEDLDSVVGSVKKYIHVRATIAVSSSVAGRKRFAPLAGFIIWHPCRHAMRKTDAVFLLLVSCTRCRKEKTRGNKVVRVIKVSSAEREREIANRYK